MRAVNIYNIYKRRRLLVSQEEPTGGLVGATIAKGAEPVLQLEIVARVGLVQQQLQVVQEQLVVQEQTQRRRAVLAEENRKHNTLIELPQFY